VTGGQTYVERPPAPLLSGWLSAVWVQQIGPAAEPYVQRNLPHGGLELTCVIGSPPRVTGPLSTVLIDVLPPGTTLVGVRLRPGAAALLGLSALDLVDQRVSWNPDHLGERLALAESPDAALEILQQTLVERLGRTPPADPLIAPLVHHLQPWQHGSVGSLRDVLYVSERQLRRRCLAATGQAPKTLQMTLRFQGFLAVAQHAVATGQIPGEDGLARLADDLGYADQSHLTRECLRLSGVQTRTYLGAVESSCGCGHDHSASYTPILQSRSARTA
jgi:AraC-like DNA-binding protein